MTADIDATPVAAGDLEIARRCCVRLMLATAGVWVLLALPAWLLARAAGLEALSYAAALCVAPGCLVFLFAARSRVAKQQAIVLLLGWPLRLAFAGLGGWLVWTYRPPVFFWLLIWLAVFYQAALLVETVLLVKRPTSGTEL